MQATLGQSIKLGFGLAVGWLIGSSIFNIITGIKIVPTDYNEREKKRKNNKGVLLNKLLV